MNTKLWMALGALWLLVIAGVASVLYGLCLIVAFMTLGIEAFFWGLAAVFIGYGILCLASVLAKKAGHVYEENRKVMRKNKRRNKMETLDLERLKKDEKYRRWLLYK